MYMLNHYLMCTCIKYWVVILLHKLVRLCFVCNSCVLGNPLLCECCEKRRLPNRSCYREQAHFIWTVTCRDFITLSSRKCCTHSEIVCGRQLNSVYWCVTSAVSAVFGNGHSVFRLDCLHSLLTHCCISVNWDFMSVRYWFRDVDLFFNCDRFMNRGKGRMGVDNTVVLLTKDDYSSEMKCMLTIIQMTNCDWVRCFGPERI